MIFDFMMMGGHTIPPVNEFVSQYTSMTQDQNEYGSFRSNGEKVTNSVDFLGEGMSGETLGNRLQG